jgi:hypothetical protein
MGAGDWRKMKRRLWDEYAAHQSASTPNHRWGRCKSCTPQ